ncbi:MAG: peptidoglycan DD-metalloendopeptidase family protein [Alphaproteobacteria bacterium]|nr:peptidoglycan DD-metalloendopeptidase family protein [Alphaproteobacteria bacterium]
MSLKTVWQNPLRLSLIPTDDPMSFLRMPAGHTGLPLGPKHPGSFGFVRKHHIHEGVDLYTAEGEAVYAAEDGAIVAIEAFTGPKAGYPHWLDTDAILVKGPSGVIVYGELVPHSTIKTGLEIKAGQLLGNVTRVLRHDKGRPTIMLHLELHDAHVTKTFEWAVNGQKPASLRDPTPYLVPLSKPYLNIP